ncbi:hypothetical protein EC950943_5582B, partial [Escherichia coli 95.0943]
LNIGSGFHTKRPAIGGPDLHWRCVRL